MAQTLGALLAEQAGAMTGRDHERAMLDHWFCRTLILALPGHVRVVLAGREPPAGRWRGYGSLLYALPLTNLSPDAALELLHGRGVDPAMAPAST